MSVINTSIVSISGSRKRTKENIRVESLIPSQLRESSAVLIELLKDYYDYMNKHDNPSYEIDSINNVRDIDTPYHDYLDQIQKEIAAALPGIIVADKVKLYKNLVQYYRLRGSSDSIELFFKIIFQDNVEVYYPREDILIPSSGRWDLESRKPARVPLFDQRQPISFKMVVEPGITFKPGERISNTLGTTATVSSQVEDVLTLTGIKIPSKTNFVDIKLLDYQTCSFNTGNNTISLTNHGFSAGDRVSFSSVDSGVISGTTGITLNRVYFVITDGDPDYFSLSLTLSGSAIDIVESSVGGNINGSIVKLPEYDTFSKFDLKNENNVVIGTAQARALEPTKLYIFDINMQDSYVLSDVKKYGNFATTLFVPNTTTSELRDAIIKQEDIPATYNGFILGEKVTSNFIEINLVPDLNNIKTYRANEIVSIENENNVEIAACEVLNFSNADSKLVCKIVRGSLSDTSLAKRVVSNEDKSFAFTCTFKASTNTVTFANHGFANGDQISFSFITNTTGIQINTPYYIINKTDNTFQLSLTSGGSAIDLLENGIGSTFKKCTFTASSNLVSMTSHGFLNGDRVRFKTINSTTGIVVNTFYYVINSETDTFNLSLVLGGTAIDLTTDGTGTIDRNILPGAIRTINSIQTNESLVLSIYRDGVTSFVFELGRTDAVYSPGERVTGSSSNAFATVLSYDISNLQNKILKVVNPSKKFKINEQITGEVPADVPKIATIVAMYIPGNYIDNNGFLSDDKKIQDSYYYQQFSYVVKTGLELKSWKNEFNRLVHPAGFIFFSDMLILLKLLDDGLTGQVTKQNRIANRFPEDTELESRSEYDPLKAGLTKWLASKMTGYQPGMIRLEDIHLLVLSQVVIDTHYIITEETLADNFADNSYFIPGEIVEGSVSGIQAEVQTYDSIKYYTNAQDTQRLGTEGIGTNPGNNGAEESDQSCNFEFVLGAANDLVRFNSLQPHRLWLEDTVVFSSLSSNSISVRENVSGTDEFITTTLVEKTPYYVVGVTDYTIKISKTLRGFPIEFLSAGTGFANIEYIQKKYGHTVLHKLKLPTSGPSIGVKNFFEGETLTGLSSGTQKVITSDIQYQDNSGQIHFLDLGDLSAGNNPIPYKVGETVAIRDSDNLVIGTAEVLAYKHSTARIALHKLQGVVQTATSITGEFTRAARSITSVTKGAYRIPRSGKAAWDRKLISTILLGLVAENSNHLNRLKSQYSKQLKFFDNTPISDYSHYVIENDINNDIPWNNVGTFITTY
jgi:hypothetical protein